MSINKKADKATDITKDNKLYQNLHYFNYSRLCITCCFWCK